LTSLIETLQLVAAQVKADPRELQEFAAEDDLGGYHINEAMRVFPMGSLWGVEGQILYALIRYLKPLTVVEIGGLSGCSTSHLAAAIKRNGFGEVISVDNGTLEAVHGELIPNHLRPYVTLIRANGEDWLSEQDDQSIGFIFEDASHETELVATLSRLALRKLQPGGFLVNHDAPKTFSWDGNYQPGSIGAPYSPVGKAVQDGLAQANAYFRLYLPEPSDCGIALTVAPGEWQEVAIDDSVQSVGIAPIESVTLPPVKVTKTRKKRTAKV